MKIYLDTEFLEDGRTIELISIGLVREDGQTYYAETAFAWSNTVHDDPWLAANVVPSLSAEGEAVKPRSKIASDIIKFVGPEPEFWAYFADYDWVVLCQLYGRMIDLPDGWPMFCRDLKQWAVDRDIEIKQDGSRHNALGDAAWVRRTHLALLAGSTSIHSESSGDAK